MHAGRAKKQQNEFSSTYALFCERWRDLTLRAWSHTTTEDVCAYFKSKKDLKMDDVIRVLDRCAQYLTHICLDDSHHKIKGEKNIRCVELLFKILTEKAERMIKIHWDFQVPIEPLMKFYEARIHQLEEHDNKDYCTVKTDRVMRLLKKAQNLKTFNWTVGIPERCLFYRTRSILEALPEDLTTLNINCTESDFSLESLFRGARLSTDRTEGTAAQLPPTLQHVEIERFGDREFICCLRSVEKLRYLSITGGKFRANDLVQLVAKNPDLEHLALRNMDYLTEGQFEIVSKLPNLTSLHLHKLPRLDGPSLTNLKQLRVIHLSYCRRVWLESLVELVEAAENLQEIQISGHPTPNTGALRKCLDAIAEQRECTITLATVHEGRKDYACGNCERKFGLKKDLIGHQRTVHEGRKDYIGYSCASSARRTSRQYQTRGRAGTACARRRHMAAMNDPPHPPPPAPGEGPAKRYFCDECGSGFTRRASLTRHTRSVHNTDREEGEGYECRYCYRVFSRRDLRLRHIREHHAHARTKSCPYCGKTFAQASSMRYHVRAEHLGGRGAARRHQCDECQRSFVTEHHLREHARVEHARPRAHPCPDCDKSYPTEARLNRHVRSAHDVPRNHECARCEARFVYRHELARHEKVAHEGFRYPCGVCDKAYTTRFDLKDHYKTAHMGRRDWKCDHCGKQFGRKKFMRKHIIQLHGEGASTEWPCKCCETVCASREELELHHQAAHMALTNEWACKQCDQKFNEKRFLIRHVKRLHKERASTSVAATAAFPCDLCEKQFAKKFDLIDHLRSHKRGAEWCCPRCDMRFAKKTSLVKHKRTTHEGVTYPCEICGRQYRAKYELAHHIKSIHLNKADWRCEFCDKDFKMKKYLVNHKRNVHKVND
ncbi:unnamed protein product [Trichogramma brassicae]|uniref:C2H2-type domain-containing protein n=1 Tax=Trichogramma brassicae TaxID=86971 RepID=A0A6H5I766_9HYME|nr:unnamed protein product [Trichogramma brassicae]